MAPPEALVPLQIRAYDHFVRVPVIEGVLEKMQLREVAERVLSEAMPKAPSKLPREMELELVAYHSEGPLTPDGRSPLGWSFLFVDGPIGLGLLATATQRDVALHFHTVTTWPRVEHWEWFDVAELVRIVREQVPAWADEELFLRVNLPDDVLAFARGPIRVADVCMSEGRVRNDPNACLEILGNEPREAFALQSVLEWFRTGETGTDTAFARALTDSEFAQGLRTLDPVAVARAAAAMERVSGGKVVDEIVRAIRATDEPSTRGELLALLAQVPSGLAVVALHRLALEPPDEETGAAAAELHKRWRRGDLSVARHPIDRIGFVESRRRMGRGTLTVVPLMPTYDPDRELLPVLEELGFTIRRRRLLAGDTNVLVGCTMRADDGMTELLLTSTPLPVPCHVLHIIGERAEPVADRVRRSPINYPRSTIIADVHSESPSRVHRAALYVAALRIDEAHLVPHLIAVANRTRHNEDLQRALRDALEVQSSPDALAYLEGDTSGA
jgi:hypothetical protein